MSLSELIRFRKLDQELTDEEFFNKFCKSIGRDLIVALLFTHLKNNLDAVDAVTNIQSNIMNSRDGDSGQTASCDSIDKLPSEMISECGSFLDYKQYFQFSHCNRTIYYSLHAMPKISKLNLDDIIAKLPKSASLRAFKNIESLKMKPTSFSRLSTSNQATWANNDSLKELELSFGHCNDDEIILFQSQQHMINSSNSGTLTLRRFSSSVVFDTLLKFENISRLNLDQVRWPDDNYSFLNLTPTQIREKLPNIRELGLHYVYGPLASDLVSAFHLQLKLLDICNSRADEVLSLHQNLLFPRMHYLGLGGPFNVDAFSRINTLKSIFLRPTNENQIYGFLKWMSTQKLLNNVMLSCGSRHSRESSAVCENIETGLIEYNGIGGESDYLNFHLRLDNMDINKIALHVLRIANAMKDLTQKNWKLSLYTQISSDTAIDLSLLDKSSIGCLVSHQIIEEKRLAVTVTAKN